MTLEFPSREFDDAVAALCHGVASDEQMAALHGLLRTDPAARDEYLLRVALHARLASDPDLFAASGEDTGVGDTLVAGVPRITAPRDLRRPRALALAAGVVLLLGLAWWFRPGAAGRRGETSRAVAMLNRVVNARWADGEHLPRLGAALEPGPLRLDAGLAQIVFYNGARVAIEGPAELRLVSSSEAVCVHGRLTAEVPPQARGFRVGSPRLDVTEHGTSFGLKVDGERSELHAFEGRAAFRTNSNTASQALAEGSCAVVEGTGAPRLAAADRSAFADLFDLQAKSVAAEARRYDAWREAIRLRQRDASLWVHLDFEHGGAPAWRLPNSGARRDAAADATIVGCEWREGRWATKPALEFRGVSDRVRLDVPGTFESATLAAWVRVQGLDRQINSLFMSDGFAPGTLHWVIRGDGVLGLTVIGNGGAHQILASPPVMTLDQFGIWTHLAVVLDGPARQVVHFVNGRPVSRHALRMASPFRIGPAELGNWNANGNTDNDPFLIRNFSGAMDEFCLFARPLSAAEIGALFAEGRPQSDTLASREPNSFSEPTRRNP